MQNSYRKQNIFNTIENDAILKTRIHVALKAKLYDSGVVIARGGKVITLKGRALDNHIRQLKKELAAMKA